MKSIENHGKWSAGVDGRSGAAAPTARRSLCALGSRPGPPEASSASIPGKVLLLAAALARASDRASWVAGRWRPACSARSARIRSGSSAPGLRSVVRGRADRDAGGGRGIARLASGPVPVPFDGFVVHHAQRPVRLRRPGCGGRRRDPAAAAFAADDRPALAAELLERWSSNAVVRLRARSTASAPPVWPTPSIAWPPSSGSGVEDERHLQETVVSGLAAGVGRRPAAPVAPTSPSRTCSPPRRTVRRARLALLFVGPTVFDDDFLLGAFDQLVMAPVGIEVDDGVWVASGSRPGRARRAGLDLPRARGPWPATRSPRRGRCSTPTSSASWSTPPTATVAPRWPRCSMSAPTRPEAVPTRRPRPRRSSAGWPIGSPWSTATCTGAAAWPPTPRPGWAPSPATTSARSGPIATTASRSIRSPTSSAIASTVTTPTGSSPTPRGRRPAPRRSGRRSWPGPPEASPACRAPRASRARPARRRRTVHRGRRRRPSGVRRDRTGRGLVAAFGRSSPGQRAGGVVPRADLRRERGRRVRPDQPAGLVRRRSADRQARCRSAMPSSTRPSGSRPRCRPISCGSSSWR